MNTTISINDAYNLPATELIVNAQEYLFNFDYALKEEHKKRFEQKFMREYLMKEISHETPALFKLRLKNNLDLICPQYNRLYELQDKDFDIFNNFDYEEVSNSKSSGKSTSKTKNVNTFKNEGDVRNWNVPIEKSNFNVNTEYPSTADANRDTGNSEGLVDANNEGSNTDETKITRKGMQGVNVLDIMIKYQQNLFDVDRLIIEDNRMKDLFLGNYRVFN